MTVELLDRLTSQGFEESIGPLLPPSILRRVLQRHPLVQELTVAFRVGTLTEQNLRDFIKTELHHLRRGEPLRHDVAIAALAVALESSPSAFASEFVTGLAALEIVEMQQSVLMAKECAKHRKAAPCTVRKTFEVEVAPTTSEPRAIVPLVDEGRRFRPPNTFEKHSDLNDAHATP